MGYWDKAAKALAQQMGLKDVSVSEDWETFTVTIEANNLNGEVGARVGEAVLETMKDRFGTTNFLVTAKPDGRYAKDPDYDHQVGAFLVVTLMCVKFPKPPG